MTIGTSLFLIATGAILRYAVTAEVDYIDLQATGVVLMIVGCLGLALGLFLLLRARYAAPPSPPPGPAGL